MGDENTVEYEVFGPGGMQQLIDDLKEYADEHGGGASIDLGITDAAPGQVATVKTVDANGAPASWEAVTIHRTLTVTCTSLDGTTVTGQTVTVRRASAEGEVLAQSAYNGQPVSFALPVGTQYHVSVNLREDYITPSGVTGTIGAADASVTMTYALAPAEPLWDDVAGYYTNRSVTRWLAAKLDGLSYGVSVPKGSTVACIKTGANASIAVPTPGYTSTPAVDAYTTLGPFFHCDCNGYVDADGTPHVTAFDDDASFARDGTNGDVWVLAPVLYWSIDESGENTVEIAVSDTQLTGMVAQPQAYLPDGTMRPYMLYAKYAGVKGSDNKMHSYSGKPAWTRDVSHNSLITQCDTANTGYSGKSIADDWYPKVMFLLKYATKDSQSVFKGCCSYNYNYPCTVAETGATRVIIATSNANSLVVGSSVTFGSSNNSTSVLGNTKILSIETYDASNSAVNLDVSEAFDTTVDYKLSTAPWHSGSCDGVTGDGTPSQAGLTSGKEPFVLQGIECMVGHTEVLGDVILSNDGNGGAEPCVNYDSRNEATSLTSDYARTAKRLETAASAGWRYPMYPSSAGGLLFGAGDGASQTTGLCDGQYMQKNETVGTYEWLGVGYLGYGGIDGLWYVDGSYGLGYAGWLIGSRLSGTGRSRTTDDEDSEDQAA